MTKRTNVTEVRLSFQWLFHIEWRNIMHTRRQKAVSEFANQDRLSFFCFVFGRPWVSVHMQLPGSQKGKRELVHFRIAFFFQWTPTHSNNTRTYVAKWFKCLAISLLFSNLQLKLWGFPYGGWKGNVWNRFPTPVCKLSYIGYKCSVASHSGSCTPTSEISVLEFVSIADSNPDVGLNILS